MSEPVVELENVTVARGGQVVLSDLNWTVREGEAWAVVGPTGSGKTTLAEVILGRHSAPEGAVRWPLLDRVRAAGRKADYPSQVIAHVTFKEESRLFSYAGHYYQQRFEFADVDTPLSLDQFLRAGAHLTDADVFSTTERLGIREQLPQPFMTLSNGQTRRARLARALLAKPELLILDDPFIGLDSQGREDLSALLGELVKEGKRLVLICRADLVPAWVTGVLRLGRDASAAHSPPSLLGKGAGGLGEGDDGGLDLTPQPPFPGREGGQELGEVPSPPSLLGKGAGGLGGRDGGGLDLTPQPPFPGREGRQEAEAERLGIDVSRPLKIVRGQRVEDTKRQRAKELRRQMTPAETVLWERLRRNQLGGFHFRRQQVIGGYIADFYCHAARLAVELDGPIHDEQKEYDVARDDAIRQFGIVVVRFSNAAVLQQTQKVLDAIEAECRRLVLQRPDPAPLSPPSLLGKGAGGLGGRDVGGLDLTPQPPFPGREGGQELGEVPSPPSLLGKGAGGLGRDDNPTPNSASIIEFQNVSVTHAGRVILDKVSWSVRAGERWAVVGPNGSGKTTLLSLLCGDHPQAYANDIRLFGRRRGTGETIWDVKRNVGLVSPEFHLYFTESLTAERAAATGFFDGVADHPTTTKQAERVSELFAAFGISHLAGRPFKHLSTGEQRLVLLARALVKRPPLVILDEPFQGLDAERVELCRDWLDRELGDDQTLLFVTHELAELPDEVTQTLRLEKGKIVN